jgi:hypothetical protein
MQMRNNLLLFFRLEALLGSVGWSNKEPTMVIAEHFYLISGIKLSVGKAALLHI